MGNEHLGVKNSGFWFHLLTHSMILDMFLNISTYNMVSCGSGTLSI